MESRDPTTVRRVPTLEKNRPHDEFTLGLRIVGTLRTSVGSLVLVTTGLDAGFTLWSRIVGTLRTTVGSLLFEACVQGVASPFTQWDQE